MRKGLLFLLACAGCAPGQMNIVTAPAAPMDVIAGAPYSAQVTTQSTQVLADGNRDDVINSGSVARDSQGRVRRDEALPAFTSVSLYAPHVVMIDDPVAKVHWTLDAQTKTATRTPMPGRNNGFDPLGFPPPPSPTTQTYFYSPRQGAPLRVGASMLNESNMSKTDLGTQMLEGIRAQGERVTRTIPGNGQPIVITTETWYSPELKVLVMSKSSDPRMGETNYRLTNIRRAEPAASLFRVPDDYKVKDQPGTNFFYQEVKKKQ